QYYFSFWYPKLAHLVVHRIRELRIPEAKIVLVSDGFHREHVARRVLQARPDHDRVDREDHDEDRRDDGPPELEHGIVVHLHADRVGRVRLLAPEHDRKVDDVAG